MQYANVLLKGFTGHTAPPSLLVLVCVIAGAALAYRDVKLSARAMLWIEAVSVLCIVVVLLLVLWKNGLHLDWPQLKLQGSSVSSIRLGLVLAIFSFVGFESATALGHEAKEPLRTIPRAVLQCAVGAGVFFMLSAYAQVLGFRGAGVGLDKSDAPMHVLANQANVPVLGVVIDAGAVVAMFACILACLTAAARILLLMAHNGLVPLQLARTHHRNDTPAYRRDVDCRGYRSARPDPGADGLFGRGHLRVAGLIRSVWIHYHLRTYLHRAPTAA